MPAAHALRVLLVDDQASIRSMMRQTLQQIGIRDITEDKNGFDAMSSLKAKRFDLILSDWNMDGIDGLQLLQHVRSTPLTAKTAFIMATGTSDKEQVRKAIQAGVNNYIVKPFSAADLKKKIEQVLGPLT